MPEKGVVDGWVSVPIDEWNAFHRVAVQAREAVLIAEDAGVYLGPLRAALDTTAYRMPAR